MPSKWHRGSFFCDHLENAKNADGFVEITKLKPSHRTRVEAECCEECRMLVIHY